MEVSKEFKNDSITLDTIVFSDGSMATEKDATKWRCSTYRDSMEIDSGYGRPKAGEFFDAGAHERGLGAVLKTLGTTTVIARSDSQAVLRC